MQCMKPVFSRGVLVLMGRAAFPRTDDPKILTGEDIFSIWLVGVLEIQKL